MLELIDKGVQAWQNVQLLKACRELGVRLSWNFLWGFPGESDGWYAEMAAWLPALEHLQPPSGVIRVRYDRFSPYHQRPGKYGLVAGADAGGGARLSAPAPGAARPDLLLRRRGAAGRLLGGRRRDHGGAPRGPGDGRRGPPWRIAFWQGEPPALQVEDVGEELVGSGHPELRRWSGTSRSPASTAPSTWPPETAPASDRVAAIVAEDTGLAAGADEVAAAVERLMERARWS